jgi:hypothetical protein
VGGSLREQQYISLQSGIIGSLLEQQYISAVLGQTPKCP